MHHSKGIVVRTTADREQLQAVFRLRYENYLRKGYISTDPSGIMSDDWDSLAVTTHLIAMRQGRILGAARLILDSERGLPMERVFTEEIRSLRSRAKRLAEASALVTVSGTGRSSQGIWLRLCKAVWAQAKKQNADEFCIAVTQNHLGFYERLLFRKIGPGRYYKALNNVFAYPLSLPVGQAEIRHTSKGNPRAVSLLDFLLETKRSGDRTE